MITLSERANIGPCADIKAHGGLLYALQPQRGAASGRLCVLRPHDLSLVCQVGGLGMLRQIEFVGDIAVISAREDGVYFFDVSAPQPRLLCKYRTVEYATGVAVWGNLAFISCRQYGVQVLDISDPAKPVHISLIAVGEVQSAVVCDDILYCGAWGEMKVVAVDIKNPAAPEILSQIPLMGRGDGVCVRDGILYAATGQHARGLLNANDPADPAFGAGNGVELFDVRDPRNHKRLKGKSFEKHYNIHVDMWECGLYGDTLVVNNTSLGVYGLSADTLQTRFRLIPPACPAGADAVTGVTAAGGDLFVATHFGDVFACRGLGLEPQAENRCDIRKKVQPQPFRCSGAGGTVSVGYGGSFPVLACCEGGGLLALACAENGVAVLNAQTLALQYKIPTEGQAQDVALQGSRLYVAQEHKGVAIFSLQADGASCLGGFASEKPVYQLCLSHSGRFLMCGLAADELAVYGVADPRNPVRLYDWQVAQGPLYGNNFALGKQTDHTMVAFCHRDGLVYTNPDMGDMAFHVIHYRKKKGFCVFCAGEGIAADGQNIYYTYRGGYVPLSTADAQDTLLDDLPHICAERPFRGLMNIGSFGGGRLLAVCRRCTGQIWLLDMADPKAPRLLSAWETNASPGAAVITSKWILIPGGRSGLLAAVPDREELS